MRTLLRLIPVAIVLTIASSAYALSPVACTMDAKLCPDGVTYVGRDGLNNCEWEKCPGEEQQCAPYVCMNGKTHPRCSDDGHVINYVAAPCHMDGGEVSELFNDVTAGHPNAEAIAYVKAEGFVEGYSDGTYRPDHTINRAEFTKIIMESVASDEEIRSCNLATLSHFSDIRSAEWYVPYICVGFVRGIVQGHLVTNGKPYFAPSESINLVEAAKIITVGFGIGEPPLNCEGPNGAMCAEHAAQGDIWYKRHIVALADRNAIPRSIASFDQQITRGEMAEMIYRLKIGGNKPSKSYEELAPRGDDSSIAYDFWNSPAFAYNNKRNIIFSYAITAESGDVRIDGQSFNIEGGRWSGPQITVYADAKLEKQIDTWASDDNWTESNRAHLSGTLDIPSGQTRFLQFSVNISTPADGEMVTVKHSYLAPVSLQIKN